MDITKVQVQVAPGKQTKRSRWQSYIDDALLKTGQVKHAAIHGLDGLRWACSKNFLVDMKQVRKLVACILGEDPSLRKTGIEVANQKFIFLRTEAGKAVYGRKGADSGICIVKSKKAILIGTYGPGIQPANCNSVIEKLADYLIQHDL